SCRLLPESSRADEMDRTSDRCRNSARGCRGQGGDRGADRVRVRTLRNIGGARYRVRPLGEGCRGPRLPASTNGGQPSRFHWWPGGACARCERVAFCHERLWDKDLPPPLHHLPAPGALTPPCSCSCPTTST